MFTNNETSFYKFLLHDKDYLVMFVCLILALIAMYLVFGGFAMACGFVGMGLGSSITLLIQDYQEYKRDMEFRYEFDNWEGSSWTRDYYNR